MKYITSINSSCELVIEDIVNADATGYLEPTLATGEYDTITSINSVDISLTNCAASTTNSYDIDFCGDPSASLTFVSCSPNGDDPNDQDLTVNVVETLAGGTSGTETFVVQRIQGGSVIGTTTLNPAASNVVLLQGDLTETTYRFIYTLENCSRTHTFQYDYVNPAGATATCPALASNAMTLSSSVSGITNMTINGNDLEFDLSSFNSSYDYITVNITLNVTNTSSESETINIQSCILKDCDNDLKCLVHKKAICSEDYEYIALYEALTFSHQCSCSCDLYNLVKRFATNCKC